MSRQFPLPSLPDPAMAENGQRACNEPLRDADGKVVGYCTAWIGHSVCFWRNRGRRSLKPHKGPHRVEWWTS